MTTFLRKFQFILMALAITSFAVTSCSEDEIEEIKTPVEKSGIIDSWISSGDDVSALLAGFGTAEITADFSANSSYSLVSTDTSGGTVTFTGTYEVTESTVEGIYNITANQSTPSALTAEGIFKVAGDSMTYEVVQTSPSLGFSPPTATEGFGSTNAGSFGNTNIQIFRKQ